MTIPWTLERYIFREMGKTFLLTAAVLTGALGLGGGLMQMVELKEATPFQLVRLMALVLPVAGALTLPIAALFSAAATYGRFSADNEFIACRSGGINLYVLFLPAVVLSFVSAAVTFVFMSFVIPKMVRNLTEIVTADPGTWIEQRIRQPRGLKLKNYRIYADHFAAAENGDILLGGVAFVESQGESWIRYGTAQEIRLRLDREDQRIGLAGVMTGLTMFDRKEDQFSRIGRQEISASELPSLFQYKIKFLDLGQLLHYWRRPDSWPPVVESLERLRSSLVRSIVQQALLRDWSEDKKLVLTSPEGTYTIHGSQSATPIEDESLEIPGATIEEDRKGVRRTLEAKRVLIEAVRPRTSSAGQIHIEAYEVTISDGHRTYDRPRESLDPAVAAASMLQELTARSATGLLTPDPGSPEGSTVRKHREDARNWLYGTSRHIVATLHERSAFAISVLVLVILGAGLGIVFRGAHAATAFGISFVPTVLVIVLIVTGKQMAQNERTFWLGLAIMWSGIVAVGVLDWCTLARWLRR